MRTKEELKKVIATRIENAIFDNYGIADIVASISSATDTQKDELLNYVTKNQSPKIGSAIVIMLKVKAKQDALIRADEMLSDDNVSMAELDSII